MAYIGTQPKDIRSFGKAKFDFTATQGQTAFTGLDDDGKTLRFTAGQITVYLNGIMLDESDYWFYDGTELNLNSPANAGDILSVVALQTDIPNSDYVPATGGTFSGAVVANDGLTINNDAATVLTVDRATSDGTLVDFKKGGTSVGSVGSHSGFITMGQGDTSLIFDSNANSIEPFNQNDRTSEDAAITLGWSSNRFKDLYLSGGVYLGGTGAANLLDGYEEGTFTPYFASGSCTYVDQVGQYTKIGRTVSLYVYLNWTNGSALSTNIFGIPFVAANNRYWPMGSVFNNAGVSYPSDRSTLIYYINNNSAETTVAAVGNGVAAHGPSYAATGYMHISLVFDTA